MTRRTFFNAAAILALVAALFGLNRAAVSAAPALNDSFANATLVGSLPFSDTVDLSEATTEPSEPQVCNFLSNTAWYALTPASNVQLRVDTQGSTFSNIHFATEGYAGTFDPQTGVLAVAVVPEPGAFGLATAGLAILGMRRRRPTERSLH